MVALALLDWRTTLSCVIMLLPYLVINRHFMNRIAHEQVVLNNETENEVLTF